MWRLRLSAPLQTASSTFAGTSPDNVINGERGGVSKWQSSAPSFAQWVEINFNTSRTIYEVDVFCVQDSGTSAPTLDMTFGRYGITAFDVQFWMALRGKQSPGFSITTRSGAGSFYQYRSQRPRSGFLLMPASMDTLESLRLRRGKRKRSRLSTIYRIGKCRHDRLGCQLRRVEQCHRSHYFFAATQSHRIDHRDPQLIAATAVWQNHSKSTRRFRIKASGELMLMQKYHAQPGQ
jgi:hypothetical protein